MSPGAGSGRAMRIAVVANTTWYLYNFRRNLMSCLRQDGHQVVAIGGQDDYVERLQHEGYRIRAVPLSAAGIAPMVELRTVLALRRALRDERVDVVLTYTPKGTIYTALALTGTRTPIVANISGLGRAFARGGWLAHVVRCLYRLTLRRRARWVFFQNDEDRQQFLRHRLIEAGRARRVPGSGVDLQRFQPRPARTPDGALRVLMMARLLWSKGVREYVEAARRLRLQDPGKWHFALLGSIDASPDTGVPAASIEQWVSEGWIDYLGSTDDVRRHIEAADCVVLPSYYPEGVPRSLLEAAAMARPVITTDSTGCRDCVEHGVTGLLCRPRDADELINALNTLAALGAAARQRMGLAGRCKMERDFDEALVIEQYRLALAALSHDAAYPARRNSAS